MAIALVLHLLAATVWVGGLFFAYMILRPALQTVADAPVRLQLWLGVFRQFFPWVWGAIAVLFASGLWMLLVGMGGFGAAKHGIHVMLSIGVAMALLFTHLYFEPYRRFKQAVQRENYSAAADYLARIRKTVRLNTVLGLVTLVIAGVTRYV